jgi:hypothetical protein
MRTKNKEMIKTLLLLLVSVNLFGQKIKGQVSDNEGNPVPYAHVTTINGQGTITNENGWFELFISIDNEVILRISCIGFEKKEININTKDTDNIKIELTPKIYLLKDILVSSKKIEPLDIVKSARDNISKNYLNKPFSREEFVRIKRYSETGALIQNLETYWEEYLGYGYDLNKKHRRVQMVNNRILFSENNRDVDQEQVFWDDYLRLKWHDITWNRDLYDNFSSFEYSIDPEVYEFDSLSVYAINYRATKPEDIKKGGWPNAQEVTGKIYIEESTFAILRIEETIILKTLDKVKLLEQELNLTKKKGYKPQPYHEKIKYILNFKKQGEYYFLVHSNATRQYLIYDKDKNSIDKETSCSDLLVTTNKTEKPNAFELNNYNWLLTALQQDSEFWTRQNSYSDIGHECIE